MFRSLLLSTPLGSGLGDTLLPGRWRWGWEWLVLYSGRRTLPRASVGVTLTLVVRLGGGLARMCAHWKPSPDPFLGSECDPCSWIRPSSKASAACWETWGQRGGSDCGPHRGRGRRRGRTRPGQRPDIIETPCKITRTFVFCFPMDYARVSKIMQNVFGLHFVNLT